MYNRLIAFGCSLTFGQYLDKNVYINDVDKPSYKSWPYVLSNLLDISTCINISKPGISNKQIAYNVLNFDFEENDLVFVLYTHLNRHCIIGLDKIKLVNTWFTDSTSTNYYKYFYNSHDNIFENYLYFNQVENFFRIKNIKNINMIISSQYIKNMDTPKWSNISWLNIFFDGLAKYYPKAFDNQHPGVEAHNKFAVKIKETFLTKNYIKYI